MLEWETVAEGHQVHSCTTFCVCSQRERERERERPDGRESVGISAYVNGEETARDKTEREEEGEDSHVQYWRLCWSGRQWKTHAGTFLHLDTVCVLRERERERERDQMEERQISTHVNVGGSTARDKTGREERGGGSLCSIGGYA